MRRMRLPAENSSSEGNLSAMMPVNLIYKQSLDERVMAVEWLGVILKRARNSIAITSLRIPAVIYVSTAGPESNLFTLQFALAFVR